MIELKPFAELGGADHGWLKAKHHFSFASYYDPANMGHGSLRVWKIATAPEDKYFPVAESLALAALSRGRVTVTSGLAHATPRLDPRNLVDLVGLDVLPREVVDTADRRSASERAVRSALVVVALPV